MYRSAHILLVLSAIIVLSCLPGCDRRTAAWQRMDLAEEMMDAHPDSALTLLDSIDSDRLGGREEEARYALLRSMALDKNYIDTTDFAVLQPAIDYYLAKGTPNEKLRTYYYQGRIYQNAGDQDNAMKAFVLGLDVSTKSTDTLYIARTLEAQGLIFKNVYDEQSYIENYSKAAELYSKVGKSRWSLDCLLSALEGATLSKNKELADSLMKICN